MKFRFLRWSLFVTAVFVAGFAAMTVPGSESYAPERVSAAPEEVADSSSIRLIEVDGEASRYWSRWRGPSGQGIVDGTGYTDTWSETQNVRWRVEVPGRGHSSPIIWKDKIFLTSAATDGSERWVLAFSRSDGKLLWQTAVPKSKAPVIYSKNSYASSTVSTDGERVYAYVGNGGLLAVDLNGKVDWHADFGNIDLYHGPASTPLLYKDRLFVLQEQRSMSRSSPGGPGFLVAIDKKTGKELWRNERSPRAGWGTPVAVQVGDRVEIIVSSGMQIDAYDPETGESYWYCKGNKFETIPTPVVGHGMVYCTSGRAGPTLAVRPGGKGDVTDSRVTWKTSKGSPFVPSPLIVGDYLYTINDMVSVVTAHKAADGEQAGQLRLGRPNKEGFSASPVAVEGKLYFTNDQGETYVLSPAPDFKILHVNKLGEQTLASPALVDGKWYFRTVGHLVAIG